MPIKGLTTEQHLNVLKNLVSLSRSIQNKIPSRSSDPEYTSLMICFLMHNLNAADSLVKLFGVYGKDYFPATVGYTIVRPMFEIDVTAHYISQDRNRAAQYIQFGKILTKKQMDACKNHLNSKSSNWQEATNAIWTNVWQDKEKEICRDFNSVKERYSKINSKQKLKLFSNWHGKQIKDIAKEVNHEEAYDLFYADLSSFSHADVRLADRFLRFDTNGIYWSQKTREFDVASVIRYADIFLNCFLELFGHEFKTWSKADVRKCWGYDWDDK